MGEARWTVPPNELDSSASYPNDVRLLQYVLARFVLADDRALRVGSRGSPPTSDNMDQAEGTGWPSGGTLSRYFSPLRVGGKLAELSHLEPFTIIIQSEKVGKPLRTAITFTNHCFSASHGDIPHPPGDEVIWDGAKMRTFCPTRYRLSHALPEVIRSLPEQRVILAAHETTWIHTLTIENPNGPYHLFLTIKRSPKEKRTWQDIDVIVESAYPETRNAPTTTGSWRPFVLVCGDAYLSNPQKPKKKRRG